MASVRGILNIQSLNELTYENGAIRSCRGRHNGTSTTGAASEARTLSPGLDNSTGNSTGTRQDSS